MKKEINAYEVGQYAAARGVNASCNPFYAGSIEWVKFNNGHEDYVLRHYHF